MEGELPPKEELHQRAVEGPPITQAEASQIAAAETDITGFGPIKGGPASVAQSEHDRQQNFFAKAGDIARKPTDQITKEDAAQVQKAEARALREPPGKGSTAANVQSIADLNENAKRV
ncbi:uncharacterized protein F4812DRAFT_457238 [Daldinia caldariorum]|uniref:uncharacterized protein n=1 Tax=Daldinia caldariorum TaxID=326644 RepID=UPI002007FB17|nr:uncharacterized protein F4812DRAFT_457238 [Daldinia caldariorum]KAI1469835.1 hypothetical protein F4812DRAFT_457238 [Daldinia caldariorum]